jgi:hypothetical protein
MAVKTKNRTLAADPAGLAIWLERESQSMHPLQFYREGTQNEIEADATEVVIDGYQVNGKLLARLSGNGHGMTPQQLISHLSSVMKTDKGSENYGVGARLASLSSNPAGVTFASRTATSEAMIKIIKDGSAYAVKNWEVRDDDNALVMEEAVLPDKNMLANVKNIGTAVILHGNGQADTWDGTLAHKVHKYLANRYYTFPDDVKVTVVHLHGEDKRLVRMIVRPFGKTLADWAISDGHIPFKNLGGLNGVIFWWVLPEPAELGKKMSSQDGISPGIGLVLENEIFDYGKNHLTDFGIQYRSVQNRVVILVAVDGAQMDTSRTGIVYPFGEDDEKRTTPWKKIGALFSEHMPAEIDALMSAVTPASSIFTDEAAKKLDADWMKWIKPVPVIVPAKVGAPLTGSGSGDAIPPGQQHRSDDPIDPPGSSKPKHAAHRQNSGNKTAVEIPKIVTPKAEFVPATEMPEDRPYIFWNETRNTVQISKEFPPYVREVKNWMETTDHAMSVVEKAVESAYAIEYCGFIIDANGQVKAKLSAEEIENLKSDTSLYAKALGCQSLTETIGQLLKKVGKAV